MITLQKYSAAVRDRRSELQVQGREAMEGATQGHGERGPTSADPPGSERLQLPPPMPTAPGHRWEVGHRLSHPIAVARLLTPIRRPPSRSGSLVALPAS